MPAKQKIEGRAVMIPRMRTNRKEMVMKSGLQNRAKNRASVKRRGPGNPEKGKPFRWKKGQSGNPGGRPRKTLLTDAYRTILGELVPGDPAGRSYAEMIAESVVLAAIEAKQWAVVELADRTEGKSVQALALGVQPIDFGTREENERRIAELLAKCEVKKEDSA